MGYRCSPPPRPPPPLSQDFTRDSTATARPIAILSLGQLARAICIRICETSLRPLTVIATDLLSVFRRDYSASFDRYRAMRCRLDLSTLIDDVSRVAELLRRSTTFVLVFGIRGFRYILRSTRLSWISIELFGS